MFSLVRFMFSFLFHGQVFVSESYRHSHRPCSSVGLCCLSTLYGQVSFVTGRNTITLDSIAIAQVSLGFLPSFFLLSIGFCRV